MSGERRVLWTDSDAESFLAEGAMQFHLTYEGQLLGASRSNTRAKHKHEIRQAFHKQLRRLWQSDPVLRDLKLYVNTDPLPEQDALARFGRPVPAIESLASNFARNGYRFVPLVIESFMTLCKVEILFLRPDLPGGLLESGDIDNRIKTIFDALRMPKDRAELGGYDKPGSDDDPFFVLLEDDKLIDSVSVTTGLMLEALEGDQFERNHARLFITITTRSGHQLLNNGHLR
jgi:hypothetical protein